jgi:hypothetical protein
MPNAPQLDRGATGLATPIATKAGEPGVVAGSPTAISAVPPQDPAVGKDDLLLEIHAEQLRTASRRASKVARRRTGYGGG